MSLPKFQLRPYALPAALFLAGLASLACSGEARRDLPIADRPGAMAPRLWSAGDRVHLSWLEPALDGPPREVRRWALRTSRLEKNGWSAPATVAEGEDFFRNWADTPGLATARGGERLAHWLRRLGGDTYAYGIALASAPGEGAFADRGFLHQDDLSPTEHGFVSLVGEGDGFRAFWLDGRAMAAGGGHEGGEGEGHGEGAMQLRSVLVGKDGAAGASELLDERVCECCQTDAALAVDGPVVVYRDRAVGEIRDIQLIRRKDGRWQPPVMVARDLWRIPGCPVNGPAVVADGHDVAVAWFTAAQERARVQVAFSQDGGASFAPPVVVDEGSPLGRIDIAPAGKGGIWVAWLAKDGEAAALRLRCFAAGGDSETITVAPVSAQRSSGVPRLGRQGDRLVVAWVEDVGGTTRLASASLPAQCS